MVSHYTWNQVNVADRSLNDLSHSQASPALCIHANLISDSQIPVLPLPPIQGLANPIALIIAFSVHWAPLSVAGIHTHSSPCTENPFPLSAWHPPTCTSELNLENSSSGKQSLMTPQNWPGDLLFAYLIKYYKYPYTLLSAPADSLRVGTMFLVSLTPNPVNT